MADFRKGLHLIPEHMVEGVVRWIEWGLPPGDFLTALLSNDLMGAFARADEQNAASMRGWAMFLYNYAPSECYGSQAKVLAWSNAHAEARKLAKESPDAPTDF